MMLQKTTFSSLNFSQLPLLELLGEHWFHPLMPLEVLWVEQLEGASAYQQQQQLLLLEVLLARLVHAAAAADRPPPPFAAALAAAVA